MELGLSLGDTPKPFGFMEKPNLNQVIVNNNKKSSSLGFCMALSIGSGGVGGGKPEQQQDKEKNISNSDVDEDDEDDDDDDDDDEERERERVFSLDNPPPPPVQLNLLPLAPVPLNHLSPPPHASPWPSSDNGQIGLMTRGFDVNRLPAASAAEDEVEEGGAAMSSSPSGASSFQMDLCMYSGGGGGGLGGNKRDSNELLGEGENGERTSSRASDDDENGSTRKKLRLSKDQSAFLEESFKEHNTLNPKQKLALAKQLNLRPRQVEVWFQNRRARTKLKQTEVDCEYLKRCCETLTEENRRLHKELQELRTLKSSNSNPFFMQLPATTLTMCPSCERVATTTTTTNTTTATTTATNNTTTNHPPNTTTNSKQTPFSVSRPRFYPFSHSSQQAATHQSNQSKAS